MLERLFLKKNVCKWKQMEADVRNPSISADDLSQSFIEVTDDLAYAKTFYPGSNIIGYLNGLASLYHQKIYRNKKESRGRITWFWQYELPYLFRLYRKTLFTACIIFLVCLAIGIFSAIYDEDFIRLIMGDGYVNMTLQNIKSGDPFGVYKQRSPFLMFLGIASNNIKVTFIAFVSGIFFSIGPIILLFKNIVMLGSFETFFFKYNLGVKSMLVVFIHGTLEIWGIIMASASGMILGNSLLFPGTYSRKESMLRGARDGLKIVFGLVPLFLIAAFLESYVTRHTGMPVWLSCAILLASLAFIAWYFFLYPEKIYTQYTSPEKPGTPSNFYKWKTKKSS